MDAEKVTAILKASQDAFDQRERAETYRRRALALLEQVAGVRYEMRQKLEAAEMNYQVLQGEIERLRAKATKPAECHWQRLYFVNEVWVGNCGVKWRLEDGTPAENDILFCPNCGGKVVTEEER